MPQSLCKAYMHIVFRVKYKSPRLDWVHLDRIHSYIGQVINTTGCQSIRVGGVCDHVHVLCLLSREVSIAHLVEEIKRHSSRWIKTLSPKYRNFAWQGGYGVFSVSQSVVARTLRYVTNQREHHQRKTFQEEYMRFLKLYQVEYDEKYVFRD
ncbi:MAG: transposase [Bacteroidales bacterium]|nr:transposase [Bacteroidales bacterium]